MSLSAALGGSLFYTVEQARGDDSDNINYARVNVDVLGLKPLSVSSSDAAANE